MMSSRGKSEEGGASYVVRKPIYLTVDDALNGGVAGQGLTQEG